MPSIDSPKEIVCERTITSDCLLPFFAGDLYRLNNCSYCTIFIYASGLLFRGGCDRRLACAEGRPRGVEQVMRERQVTLNLGEVSLDGDLTIPEPACGVVLFAHGSGSSRLSKRNRHVASELNRVGLATMLMDLMTEEEEQDRRLVFDIGMLADRLGGAISWLRKDTETMALRIGLFGASTGAAAALAATVRQPSWVYAIVSRGGRPDLAGDALKVVQAPIRLIVGGNDDKVIEWNQNALAQLTVQPKDLVIVPGATHLFEEPGALDEVARLAQEWFVRHLCPPRG